MNDLKKPLYERFSTFDGPEYLSVSDSISSPQLSSDLEQLCVNIVICYEFTRLPEDLQKIKLKNDKKSELLKINQNIKTRSKQFIHKDYQLSNYFEQQSNQQISGTQANQKYWLRNINLQIIKKLMIEFMLKIQELCRYLDEEQEDCKIEFQYCSCLNFESMGVI
ncbi:unnamed protein product (macronuclear) [Paramecium tetraurelia]|uniref:Uncharacterized protein n=1 Tax=Paramecium tetraurelia TaxID=5888 RepID=A0DJG8_PARTE|nr:uncharacterized protein GSPATT00017529001 [Paramecium tetraurelia]CAK83185.1 unnamed protein product [Paramecium tetraurelia]|eukprot:XP_001450582.1 hypothetical protein (macronuclear) [Paramecium tetraurelia strain d4-2]